MVFDLVDGLSGDAAVECDEIHTVFGMQTYHIDKILCGQCGKIPLIVDHGIIDRNRTDHSRTFVREFAAERDRIAVGGQIHDRFRPHVDCFHDFFHFYVIVLAVFGNAEVYIDLGL